MLLHTVVYFMKGKDEKLTQCKSLFSIHCFSFIASIHKNSLHSAFMTGIWNKNGRREEFPELLIECLRP